MTRISFRELMRPTRRRAAMFVALAALWCGWRYCSRAEHCSCALGPASHRLDEADQKSRETLNHRLEAVHKLFAKGRSGSKAFAEEALSWSGKYALVKGYLSTRPQFSTTNGCYEPN